MTVYDRASSLGGVWSNEAIYDGLTTNSPLSTFEYPDWHFPEHMRRAGVHVPAKDVNAYLQTYAEAFNLTKLIRFKTEVKKVEWDARRSVWVVRAASSIEKFEKTFSHIVICTGMYHTPEVPFSTQQTATYRGKIFHSSEIGSIDVRKFISTRQNVLIVGGGKSALDLATLVAKGTWGEAGRLKAPRVTLLYRKPHWLSPWKIVRGTVPFEKLLFCRFVVSDPRIRVTCVTWSLTRCCSLRGNPMQSPLTFFTASLPTPSWDGGPQKPSSASSPTTSNALSAKKTYLRRFPQRRSLKPSLELCTSSRRAILMQSEEAT